MIKIEKGDTRTLRRVFYQKIYIVKGWNLLTVLVKNITDLLTCMEMDTFDVSLLMTYLTVNDEI